MNEKNIATIGLREGLADFAAVLEVAAEGVITASAMGADLAVLPETINLSHEAASHLPMQESALDDWRTATAPLRDIAAQHNVALVLPLLVREGDTLANRFFVLSREGDELGFYQKQTPAPGERAAGVVSAATKPIPWEGLRIGGGICIDVYFPQQVFASQREDGADLFVIPSMTPGGAFPDICAVEYGVPVVLAYSPWSRILDRDGRELVAGGSRSETVRAGFSAPVLTATINFDAVTLFADFNQQKLSDVQKHYGANVRIRFDQSNCVFLLESRSPDLAVGEVMRQFGLVSRREYFAQLKP